MRKLMAVAVCSLLGGSVAFAQTQYTSKWHCDKPTTYQSVDVGDVAGHTMDIAQGDCTAANSAIAEKTGVYTELSENWKNSGTVKGRFNVTLENGDKLFHSYQSTFDPAKKTIAEKWTIVSGTGKSKGTKGSGTCTGKLADDGTSDWECTGTVTTPKP